MDGRDENLSVEEVKVWTLPVTETYRHVRPDGTEWLFDFDRALWVEIDGDRGFISGNGHTHPGRFHVCFPDQEYVSLSSVYELTAMSTEARYWLLGFLSGHELDLYEYLGLWRSVAVLDDGEETDDELLRWKNFNKQFRSDGIRPYPNLRPDRALVVTDEERAEINVDPWQPWTYVGERVLVPDRADGSRWVEADPQPEMDGPWLAGSICADREHCNLIWLESAWFVCCDCGEVEMSAPDDH